MTLTQPFAILLHLGAFAFFISLALCGFMISAGVKDVPVERSSHKKIVPTAGGVGLVAGLGCGLIAQHHFYPGLTDAKTMAALCALAFAVAGLGLWDDISAVNTKFKFVILLILCALSVYIIGVPTHFPFAAHTLEIPYFIGFIGAVLWIFVVINAVNFMDGVNGIAAGVMMVAFLFLAAIAVLVGNKTSAVLSFVMASALAGYLPYNAKRSANIFCGDTGSLLIGFIYASSALYLAVHSEKNNLLYIAPMLVLPFLVDMLLTLLMRAFAHKNLLAPHRDHLYQRLSDRTGHPLIVSGLYTFTGIGLGVLALGLVKTGLQTSLFFLLFLVGVLSSLYLIIGRTLNTRGG